VRGGPVQCRGNDRLVAPPEDDKSERLAQANQIQLSDSKSENVSDNGLC